MLTFRKWDVSSLHEASVLDPKYPEGQEFVLKDTSIGAFQKAGLSDVDSETIFIKKNEVPGAEELIVSSRSSTYAHLEINGTVYKVIGNINGYFNHVSKKDGITWKTKTIETAQVLGVFFDANKDYEDLKAGNIKNHRPYIDKVKKIMAKGDNLMADGVSQINKGLDIDAPKLYDVIEIYRLAAGMSDFCKQKLNPKFKYVCHEGIDDFYDAEKSNPQIKTSGIKNPTPDVVVATHPAKQLINSMKTNTVDFDEATGICTLSDGIQFALASLKKEEGGAQLGKMYAQIKAKYDIPANSDLLKIAITEGWLSDTVKSAKDFVFKITDHLHGAFLKMRAKLRGFVFSFRSRWIQSANRSALREFDKLMKKVKVNRPLRESLEHMNINEAKETINQEVKGLTNVEVKNVLNNVNAMVKKISTTTKSNSAVSFVHLKSLSKLPAKVDDNTKFKLVANYIALTALLAQLKSSGNDTKKLAKEITNLLKDMYFGSTELPVYKVYGKGTKGGHSYEYLGSSKRFVKKVEKDISKAAFPIFAIKIVVARGEYYYSITSFFCQGVSAEGDMEYSMNRIGTNQAGALAFTYEGTSVIDYDKLQKKLKSDQED